MEPARRDSEAKKNGTAPPIKLGGANAKTRRGNSTKKDNAPPSSPKVAPPRKREKDRKWIEFKPGTKRKDGSRMYYPKWRKWKPGNSKKEWLGTVKDLEPMTLKEKNDYVKRHREAKKRRKQRRGRD